MPLSPGARLGVYEVIGPLGSGGMGNVYHARDTRLNRAVAIKVVDPQFAGRFATEARAISALNHPNICTLYDVGTDFLVMELVEGETLAARLAAGKLPLPEVYRVGIQVADALAAAHARGVVHRDLKPANVMLTKSSVKVLDFGLAKLATSPGETVTAAGAVLGTPAYMSPEQVAGRAADTRTDIFAIGLLIAEMATGRRALSGYGQLPRMDDLPEQLAHIIARCLAADPEDRWQSAGDVRRELEWASRAAPPPANRSGRLPRGWPLAVVTVAAAALVGVAVLGARWSRVEPPGPPVHLALTMPVGQAIEPLRGIAVARDGGRIALVATLNRAEPTFVIRTLDGSPDLVIPGAENASFPFFSPDGRWVAFFADGTLRKVASSGGVAQQLAALDSLSGARGGTWADDDTIYYGGNGGIWRVPAAGGQPQQVTHVARDHGETDHAFPQLLPGSRILLYTVWKGPGWDEREVVAERLDIGERRVLLTGAATVRYVRSGHLIYSREGRLSAVPFNAATLQVTGTPMVLFDDLREGALNADYDLAPAGMLAYVRLVGGGSAYERVLVRVDRQGTATELPGIPRAYYQNPRISPDGRQAIVQRTDGTIDLWLYDFSRETMTKLAADGSNQHPEWSPDGTAIVYRGTRKGLRNLFVRPADGSGGERRLTVSELVQAPSSWRAGTVAFAQLSAEGRADLLLVPADGSQPPRAVVATRSNENKGVLSPDARVLAYVSDESGRNQIYVQFVDGPPRRQQISADGGTDPVWSRDGRELFFRSGTRVMVAEMTAEGVASRPRALFAGDFIRAAPARDYDVAPDGQWFIMVQSAQAEPPSRQLEVVLNWPTELRRRFAQLTN